MVAAVASDEPQMAPKPAQAPTADIATPPFRWPRKLSAARKSDPDMPEMVANCPISRNSGMIEKE